MTPQEEQRAGLIAGALADDLDATERDELAALMAADPTVAAEIAELGGTVAGLRRDIPTWDDEPPSPELRERVLEAVAHEESAVTSEVRFEPAPLTTTPRTPSRAVRSVWVPAACFAAGVAVALGGVMATQERPAGAPVGPPGTLGAEEDVSFSDPADGVRIDGVLVAHTWGTETVLEIDGLPAGEGYVVVLVGEDGQEYDSGTFLGSDVVIDCRMNAAVMRADVERLEIRSDDGALVTAASLPEAVDDGA
ncbi:hypothetical protein C8046_14435 [Serinibacter arcticus]|uniref:Anti-sigma factor n=1 Tax=Serinibacter arcticus TaxID=1655435 RepID=A0A2U1ZXL4_9MICO|nr:anti-sigma factor [Serinibacter arcticus]PWD51662.1 hypothetical protein C8046_14435 [Serinibacter arcticus]